VYVNGESFGVTSKANAIQARTSLPFHLLRLGSLDVDGNLALVADSIKPRITFRASLFKSCDVTFVCQGQTDIIQSIDEAVPSEIFDVEWYRLTVLPANDLINEIDLHFGAIA
jgi:hypothetical protein